MFHESLTVGGLRRLIADLPDDAPIFPGWADGAPTDEEPGIELHSFLVKADEEGKLYLSAQVRFFYLNEDEEG